jgi:hypothetical protein
MGIVDLLSRLAGRLTGKGDTRAGESDASEREAGAYETPAAGDDQAEGEDDPTTYPLW